MTERNKGGEPQTGEVPLFNGEFLIKADGIHTFAHYYQHPITNREVVIIGLNHGGDPEFYGQVLKILEGRTVLYEDLGPDEPQEEAEEQELDPDNFLIKIQVFFDKAGKHLNLKGDKSYFDHSAPNWYCAEELLSSSPDEDKRGEIMESLMDKVSSLTVDETDPISNKLDELIQNIDENKFTRRDFAQGFIYIWSNPKIMAIFSEILGAPRDEGVFETFDRIIEEKDPGKIGIPFGAAHITNLRKLCEGRGYKHISSEDLVNLKF